MLCLFLARKILQLLTKNGGRISVYSSICSLYNVCINTFIFIKRNSMNLIFKNSGNAKYLIKSLKGVYTALGAYLNGKWPSVKIKFLNFLKNPHIVKNSIPTTVDYDEWPLSNMIWIKSLQWLWQIQAWIYQFQLNFCNILCCKYTLATSCGNILTIQICLYNCLSISCVFLITNNTASFRYCFNTSRWF